MGLWEYIEWDIDEEKQKNKKKAEKILEDFSDVEGLEDVLDGVQSLMDSEVYDKVYKASKMDPKEMASYIDTVDDLLKLRQVKLATGVLKDPPLYLPFLTDVIISTHFNATFSLISGVDYAYAQKKLGHESTVKEHAILERLMSLLDDFDKPGEFQKPDKEFYQKLKKIEWDKQGKKLFNKINGIRRDITIVKWVSDASTFRTGEGFALTFLAACNTVNKDRNKILPEDMVVASKTYLKLLNTDIYKLEV